MSVHKQCLHAEIEATVMIEFVYRLVGKLVMLVESLSLESIAVVLLLHVMMSYC